MIQRAFEYIFISLLVVTRDFCEIRLIPGRARDEDLCVVRLIHGVTRDGYARELATLIRLRGCSYPRQNPQRASSCDLAT